MPAMISAATRYFASSRGRSAAAFRWYSRARSHSNAISLLHTIDRSSGREVRFCHAEACEIVLRQVDPPAMKVCRDVADDVRQLQRDAQLNSVLLRLRARAPEDLDADQSNRGRDTPAVFVQRRKRRIAAGRDIHLDAVDQIGEWLPRKVKLADEGLQRPALPRLGLAVVASGQLLPPRRQRLDRRHWPWLVHRVVHRTAEVPDSHDGVPLRLRQHEERVIEAGIASHGRFLIVLRAYRPGTTGSAVGPMPRLRRQVSRRHASNGASVAPRDGRRVKTSKS